MSRRTLMSAERRTCLFTVPTTPAEMARHYVLSPEDLALLRSRRRGVNCLGFTVQLCLLGFVAGQLGIPAATFANHAQRDQTRREHVAELRATLGLRRLHFRDWLGSAQQRVLVSYVISICDASATKKLRCSRRCTKLSDAS